MKNADEDRGFTLGIVYAAAELITAFDQPTYAMHLLDAAGINEAKLRALKADPHDVAPCRKLLHEEEKLRAWRRRHRVREKSKAKRREGDY